jgi:hypothetical protein
MGVVLSPESTPGRRHGFSLSEISHNGELNESQWVATNRGGSRVRPGMWTERDPMLTELDSLSVKRRPEPKENVGTKWKPSGLVQRPR